MEHEEHVVERVIQKTLYIIVSVNQDHFGFMSGIGTLDFVFSLGRLLCEYHVNRR